ncbi:MAG: hypothetical protein WD960_01240 [Gemmatimonadota bacterium]
MTLLAVPTLWLYSPPSPAAEPCELVTVESLDLGSMEDARGPAGITWVAFGTDGRYYAVSQSLPAAGVLVYDEDGRYVGALGGAGQGPGEFEYPWRITATPGGEVLVHDLNSGVHVFGVDGAYRRTISGLPSPMHAAVAPNDSQLAIHNPRVRHQSAPAREVNVFSLETGDWLRGLGPTGELRAGTPHGVGLIGYSAAEDGLWLSLSEAGRLEKWSPAGTLLAEVEWARLAAQAGVEGIRPSALWEDPTGSELWVLVSVPLNDEAAAVEPSQALPADHFAPSGLARRFDSVIVLMDRGTGEVRAVRRWDDPIHGFLRDGRLVRMAESAEGWQWIQVIFLSLECPEPA